MSIDEALKHKLITVISRDDEQWFFTVKLGVLSTLITIEIKPFSAGGREYPYHYLISHHVHAPGQSHPYMPSRTHDRTRELVLRKAIMDLVAFYKVGVENGLTPEEGWLVP